MIPTGSEKRFEIGRGLPLLMPTDDVFSQVKSKDVSLDTLDELSQCYAGAWRPDPAFTALRSGIAR